MKHFLPSGKPYTPDHPHEVIREGIMRFAEIRQWMIEISTNPAYGWDGHGGSAGLERALGLERGMLNRKCKTHWIFPREQYRLTKRIEDILAGYIVPRRMSGMRIEGVWTDPPKPPTIREQRMLSMRVGISGIRFEKPKNHVIIPSFQGVFDDVMAWNPMEKSPPEDPGATTT